MDTELCTARDYLRVAKKLAEFPAVADAYAAGVLSYSKVRTLTRYATADNVDELLAIAKIFAASQLTQAIGAWLAKHEQPEARDRRIRGATALRCRHNADGTTTLTWTLPTTDAAKVTTAVDAKMLSTRVTPHASADYPSVAQQRSDALLRLVTSGSANIDAELILHVRGDGTATNSSPTTTTPTTTPPNTPSSTNSKPASGPATANDTTTRSVRLPPAVATLDSPARGGPTIGACEPSTPPSVAPTSLPAVTSMSRSST